MDELIDSELTMVANKAYSYVLQCVQNSGLNYQIQMSPFSAVISLKKSLIRNKTGLPIIPILPISDIVEKDLEKELALMKKKYEDFLHEHTTAMETIKWLKNDVGEHDDTSSNNHLKSSDTVGNSVEPVCDVRS